MIFEMGLNRYKLDKLVESTPHDDGVSFLVTCMKFAHKTVGFEFHKPVREPSAAWSKPNSVNSGLSQERVSSLGKSVCQWQYYLFQYSHRCLQ